MVERLRGAKTVGGRARFGDGTDLDGKLQALETMLARVDLRCIDTIDVRVPSAPALTRLPPPDGGAGDPAAADTTDEPETNASEEPDSARLDC